MVLERDVPLARLDIPYLDGFVVRAGQDLLIVGLEAANGARVALFGDPVECVHALTRVDVPEADVEVERAAYNTMRVEVDAGDRALVAH